LIFGIIADNLLAADVIVISFQLPVPRKFPAKTPRFPPRVFHCGILPKA
jgi:hypothetical protein